MLKSYHRSSLQRIKKKKMFTEGISIANPAHKLSHYAIRIKLKSLFMITAAVVLL
uniref:Uncharacterized protein n=1 Tax=Anguilla anguilla TaxID=7936 RepID=A0A0E9T9D8_ANGAN